MSRQTRPDLSPLLRPRVEQLFHEKQLRVYRQTDRTFAILMCCQWVLGVIVTLYLLPQAWSGTVSSIHPHVWAAVFLGGAIAGIPILLAWQVPGYAVTRYTIAVAQMLQASLLIHLTSGRLETHFQIFGSLAFLAFYRDWRPLVPATLVVVLDHWLRGEFWPESIYGTPVVSHWRWLEHSGWVIYEDIVLVVSCIGARQGLWNSARRTAALESSEGDLAGSYRINAEGRVLACNEAFATILGFPSRYDVIGCNTTDMHADPGERARYFDLLLANQALTQHESVAIRRDGARINLLENAVGQFDEAGRLVEIRGFILDITERKRQEAELARARDVAIESAKMKADFLANMSHEIRTPMNGVVGMSALLLETPLMPEQREFAQTIQNSAESLLTIINDILDFSKIDAGKLAIEQADFDLGAAIEGSADVLAERAAAKDLELAVQIAHDLPTALRGDATRVRQVLTNLISNAVKFTEHGEVVVRASREAETRSAVLVRIEVTDTGIGIAPAVQPKLFDAFVQADGSTTRKYGGTGLGLAICRRLVELMGGEIGLTSTPGVGSTFWFTARFEKQPAASAIAAIALAELARLRDRRMLIVDDNATNRKILHYQLTNWGIAHHAVESGREALAALRAAAAVGQPFDLLILDHHMPEMDGQMLAAAVRADDAIASTRMVMMTSLGHFDPDALREAGISVRLIKPVKQAQLRATLARVLDETETARPAPAAPVVAVPVARATPIGEKPARILVAEDNPVNQRVILLQLRQLGYAADAVANGNEAVAAVIQQTYDIVLMDCQMPELDGYQATQQIREQEAGQTRVPIIAMTAHALAGDRDKCLAAGMDDYISKPVKTAALAEVLMRWDTAKTV